MFKDINVFVSVLYRNERQRHCHLTWLIKTCGIKPYSIAAWSVHYWYKYIRMFLTPMLFRPSCVQEAT